MSINLFNLKIIVDNKWSENRLFGISGPNIVAIDRLGPQNI